jgi:hypothetical protein
LALARSQGLIYAHQLPAPNGHKPPDDTEALSRITRLLEGRADLPPVAPQSTSMTDERLDRMQQEAVARGLATPDICLIGGAPGTGKSRAAVELLTQAAARGDRILFLARRPAAVDQVLEQLAARHVVLAVRCLEAGEKPESLPAAARAATFAERVRKLREALPEALRARQRSEDRCRTRRHEEAVWPELTETAESAIKLGQRRAEITRRLAQVPEEVARQVASPGAGTSGEPTNFAALLNAEQGKHAETIAELDAALARIEQVRADSAVRLRLAEEQASRLRLLVAARKQGRFWSFSWWRALVNGDINRRLEDCERQRAELLATGAAAFEEINCFQQKRRQLDEEYQAAVEHLRATEIRSRQEHWMRQEEALAAQAQALETRWRKLVERLELPACRPSAMTSEAVEQARCRWQECSHADEENCRFAGQWASFLQESLELLPQRLPGLVNLVAATLAGLAADKHFSRGTADFDLLVVEEAEQMNEAEFLKVGQRARRWVLVGDSGLEKPSPSNGPARNGRVHRIAVRQKLAPTAPPAGPISLFQRLWRSYRAERATELRTWVRDGDRLCCRLKAIDTEQRKCLECERVADFPDIELRILSLPRAVPTLAEVLFPSSISLIQAKEYIYRELQELPLETTGTNACLVEDPDRFVLHFGRLIDQPDAAVVLAEGLCELLVAEPGHPAGFLSCRVEFAKAVGWSRERAQAWLFQHCLLRDSGRTVLLQRPYRSAPERPAPALARGPNQIRAGS